jgi:putative ABC transport system substrate-binding protein
MRLRRGTAAEKVPRIGFHSAALSAALWARIEAFREALRELGYVEEKNILIDYRFREGILDRLNEFAAEFERLKADVIVTAGPSSTRAAQKGNSTIPIVNALNNDPGCEWLRRQPSAALPQQY